MAALNECRRIIDGTEDGVAGELVAAGIPRDHIVLGFQPPEVRGHTEYAAA